MSAARHILATKLYLPQPTAMLVARLRLLGRMHVALRRPLTTIIAPAGFGKTTLVSTWAAAALERGTAAVAWVTLDAYDDEPTRFWTSVIVALQTKAPTIGDELLPLLTSLSGASPEYLLTPLINQLVEQATTPRVLVLDDYHIISAPAIHAGVTFLIEHLPPHVHVILLSRSDPPLPIARLRARNELLEVRVADLRFSEDEAAAFLNNAMGLELAAGIITELVARTEGWIAGLHLAALSMQDRSDRTGFVRALTGTHHYILDYLVEEVLQVQPPSIRTFLLQTAILDRLCASLCNAVTGTTDSATVLEAVKRANLFLIPLDDERHWYRYHHLFAEMLHALLAQEQPTQLQELHQRASTWYAQHAAGETRMLGEALRHALAAGNHERAIAIIDDAAELLWDRQEITILIGWLRALPTAVLHAHPRQALRLAQILLINESLADVPSLLDAATASIALAVLPPAEETALRGRAAVVRSYIARMADHYPQAIEQAEEALQLLPVTARTSRSLAATGLALGHHMQGSLIVADATYREAIALCEAAGDRFLEITARCLYCRVLQERGALHAAEVAAEQALHRAAQGIQRLPIAGWAMIGLGNVAYARNNLDLAEGLLVEGLDLVQRGNIRNGVYNGLHSIVGLRLAQGDVGGAHEAAAQFVRDAYASHIPFFIRWAVALQALVAFRSGDVAAANRWVHTIRLRPDDIAFTDKPAVVLFLRVLLAQGETEAMLDWSAQHRTYLAAHDHIETLIKLHLLETVALSMNEAHEAAQQSLGAALALAAPAGFIRPFLDTGEPIRVLLVERSWDGPLQHFAAQLLAAFAADRANRPDRPERAVAEPTLDLGSRPAARGARADHGLVEPLSEREREVLVLMAGGLSNHGIAERLVISVPTVKKHASNIFSKLHATSRTEAVARAREAGLLD